MKTWKKRVFVLEASSADLRYFKPSPRLVELLQRKEQLLSFGPDVPEALRSIEAQGSDLSEINDELEYIMKDSMRGSIILGDNVCISLPETSAAAFKTPFSFELKADDRTLVLCAESDAERRSWLKILKAKCMKNKEIKFKKFFLNEKLKTRIVRSTTVKSTLLVP